MRTFMLGTILMTFLSGVTSGYLVCNTTAEVLRPPTWIDQYVSELERRIPKISEDDLALAREIVEGHEKQIMELKAEIQALMGDQLRAVEKKNEKRIQAIIDSYESPSPGSK